VNYHNRALRKKKDDNEIAFRESEIVPSERWLVAFKCDSGTKYFEKTIFIRQFYAPGFYEAYDTAATFAERFQIEVLWFQEKRDCGTPYTNYSYPELESLCTYCNNLFSHQDTIPCLDPKCSATLCTRNCLQDHVAFKHK
jgi:hypothetical protein